jgi:hypothetical protein
VNLLERPSGLAVNLINPVTGEPVVFDECRERDGTMIEAKGPGYTEMLANAIIAESLAEKWVKQATSQPQASEGRGLEWFSRRKKRRIRLTKYSTRTGRSAASFGKDALPVGERNRAVVRARSRSVHFLREFHKIHGFYFKANFSVAKYFHMLWLEVSPGDEPSEFLYTRGVPIKWNHLIDKDSLKIKELEHVLIEKVEQLFRDML